jgi:hypothetical protein
VRGPRVGLVLVAVLTAGVVRSVAIPVGDTEVWWSLRLGELLSHRAPWCPGPRLSSFATSPYAPTELLPDLVGARVEHWWGLPGLAWLYGCGLAAVVVATYLSLRRLAAAVPAALSTCLVLIAASQSLTPRAQLVSMCLLPVVVVAWLRTADDLRHRWWLVPLTWLWSLCHGFWVVGAGVGCLVVLLLCLDRRATGREAGRLVGLAAACVAVVGLNPVGPRLLLAPLVVRERSAYLIEWFRTDLGTPAPLAVLLMLGITVLLLLRAGAYDVVRVALVAVAAFLTWYSTRTVALGGIVAGVVLADALRAWTAAPDARPRARRRETEALLVWSGVCLAVLALVVPHTSDRVTGVPTAFDDRLDRLPSGSVVLDSHELGGWLAWRHPDLDHYIDPLADAYPLAHLERYVRVTEAEPGWQATVRDSGARVAVLQSAMPLTAALTDAGWRTVDRSEGYVLLVAPPTRAT